MAELRYPIGIQTFSKLIEGGYTYVDKTGFIPLLLKNDQYIFLSRPRRFGKSLLLSTLEAYFEGRRDLFKGLALYDMDVDWEPSPVFHFDFNAGVYDSPDGLLTRLHGSLERFEKRYGVKTYSKNRSEIPVRFENLIETAYKVTGRRVVILVDEYDKPLLGLEENKGIFEENQRLLKSFFGCMKSSDSYIRFAFLTGVARFNKVSIFSDLNNLEDISMDPQYADICGWSEEELIKIFHSGIEALAVAREEDYASTLGALREYYDGYLFASGGSRLYNPFSVLRALKVKEIESFWFATGTPTFLAKRVKTMGVYPPEINGTKCFKEELMAVGFDDSNPMPLMFQTGYLTIGSYDKKTQIYELRFPNREVEIGFYKFLLPIYAPATVKIGSPFSFPKFMMDLNDGRPEEFMKRLATLLKDLPGEDHCESTYRAITYLISVLCGTRAIAEHHGYKGRSDIEVATEGYVYIFEFKYNKSVDEAMEQIYSRDYAGRYALDSRPVYLIGANYEEKREKRGLSYRIEEMVKAKL
ncbi:MAG: ATP-binding protein [Muribaculaceae bacterium]|nr:ATP-binding protein [Muribaculaceae bacterium]